MIISISNAVFATQLFSLILAAAFLISIRPRKNPELFSSEISQELKGLAILMVVFSHIGYFLVSDHRFLFPLSSMAGVGVNIFLFLSGFGLAASSTLKKYSILKFYKRRVFKLLIPFWLVVSGFFLLDYLVLHHFYGWSYVGQSLLGFFPSADLYRDLNSPLWYITLILFYYLIFPWVFSARRPWLAAIVIYVVSYLIIQVQPGFLEMVIHLYRVHLMAFPLGVLASGLYCRLDKLKAVWKLGQQKLLKLFGLEAEPESASQPIVKRWPGRLINYFFSLLFLAIAIYTAKNSNIGTAPLTEEITSIITMLSIVGLFLLKKIDFGLFYLVGIFSYEVYLMHWPIMYHYDFIFKYLPVWVATSLYLVVFLLLGKVLSSATSLIVGESKK